MSDPIQITESGNELELTLTPCTVCGQTSTENEEMVGCDGCNRWFHYRCVGVTSAVKKEKRWYCAERACQVLAQEYLKTKKSRSKKTSESSDASVQKSGALTLEQKRKALQEKQRRLEQELEEEMLLKEEERRMERALEKKRLLLEEEMREREEKERNVIRAEALRKKQEQVKRMRSNQNSFEQAMASLDKELEELKVETVKTPKNPNVGMQPSTSRFGKLRQTPLRNPGVQNLTKKNVKQQEKIVREDSTSDDDDEEEEDEEDQASSSNSEIPPKKVVQSTPKKTDDVDGGSEYGLGQRRTGPTKAQLAARNGITKKLPNFSGKPEEWPLFFGTYQASNEACGYTNVENLVRLQECLKGPALEWVRGQLLLPQSVPRVITKLQQLYGRPEQLLQSHLEKVRKLESPRADRLASFIPFGNAVEQLCEHLEAADLKQHLVNPLLIQDLVDKLPDVEKRQWVRFKRDAEEVTLRTFTDFLGEIVTDACEANVSVEYKPVTRPSSGSQAGKTKGKGAVYNHSEEESSSVTANVERRSLKPCKVCQRTDHRLRYCPEFKKLRYADRLKVVNHWKLCCVCLNDHSGRCTFKIQCNVGECRERHNPLMHPVNSVVGTSAHIRNQTTVMFRMIPVQLHHGGRSITVLAFLDEGASVTLVEKRLADRLGLVGIPEKLTIKWTADIAREEKDSRRMNMWASAVGGTDKLLLHTVRTVGKLMLPHQKLNADEIAAKFKHMRGLPIASYDGQPGMLIGLNNVHSFAPMEAKLGAVAEPIAVRCQLGWTVYGPRQSNADTEGGYLGHHHEISNEDLHDLLKSHYALEESVVAVAQESAEDQRAREIMERTTKRVGDRFETGLLWRSDDPRFPDSFPMALRRMKQLERRLEKNPELHENVCRQIEEYQQKGYAHVATTEELTGTESNKVWYLPLNAVTNPRKPGKVRLVWDAAASVQGVSLNTQLLAGPDLLVPLVKVIVGFRERPIAFGGDIREMYHQLRIIESDRQAQRFVFRKNVRERPSIFVMDVATFGATCSPCSAQYVKNKNAEEHAVQYPEAAAAILHRHYVDDYFDSVDTVEAAVNRAKQVRMIHKNGGFEIRNWVSNAPEVLRSLGEERQAGPVHFNQDKQTNCERVLGIIWDPETDVFTFSTQHRAEMMSYLYEGKRPTKQIALSCVMGFFDPLGLLSPFTIHGKIIIQHLWRLGCDWKEEIDDESWGLWKRWTSLLPEVEAVRITRCYFGNAMSSAVESLELHIFTDASEHAYGCVAYLRAVIDGNVRCSLVMSRAKVAPLKRQSIPRLELMAALLGARLKQTILGMHSLDIKRCVMWTDSRTVCSWLQSDQYKFKQFVAFRIGEILELTRVTDWRWVPTKQNIADVMTKWGRGPPLSSEGEWFNGKSFLYLPEESWPQKEKPYEETNEEARGVVLFHEVVNVEAVSRWVTLVRVAANVVRFIENCRRKKKGQPIVTSKATKKQQDLIKAEYFAVQQPMQQEELQKAETMLWKQAQFDSFPDEMSALTKNLDLEPGQKPAKIERSSILFKLTPRLDEEGVMRMNGRLAALDDIPFDQKFPIILSRQHDITRKMIQSYHERFGHANRETVCNELRQKFWIPNIRAAILKVMGKCMWCKVHRCRPRVPMMAPLPTQRVRAGLRPFSSVGVDYLGPVEVSVGRRKEKRWVAVFTCLTVRAVHLEVVNSLTTQSCLMAIRRFECKRGVPDEILSDNATCFKGASNEMQRMKEIHGECAEAVTTATTAWRFIPPGTPHMGGAWERMVRSVKEAMKALDDGRKLSDEILVTTLAEAEDMINTRPLTYVPQESAEREALTPNHFLRGAVKSADLKVDSGTSFAEALRDVYKRSQYLADMMWERWRKEYLPTINRRAKWFDDSRPLKVGDLVFVVDGKDRKQWTRGIVEEAIPGADGRVREARVRTAAGVHRRAVANLAVMEIEDCKSESQEELPDVTGWGVNTAGHTASA